MPEIEDIIETPETASLLLWWQWTLIILALLIAIFLLSKLLKKKASKPPVVNNLKSALDRLEDIQKGQLDDTELATELSTITRQYLQHQLNNKAIFQTHKEFVQDHSDLDQLPESARKKLAKYLELLAHSKYLPESNLDTEQSKLISHTESLLRGIASTIPRSI